MTRRFRLICTLMVAAGLAAAAAIVLMGAGPAQHCSLQREAAARFA